MRLPFFIARHYLFSKKSSNAINVISWISVFSIAVATFALVVVLSAFNGLQFLVESMYEEFDADIKITLHQGKWINPDNLPLKEVSTIQGVNSINPVIEDLTLVRYGKQQSPCTIKGVNESFISNSGLEEKIFDGSARLEINRQPTAIIGYGLASVLSVYVDNAMENLRFYAPKLNSTTILNPEDAFRSKSISPSGVFMINPDIDNKYILVPLEFAQDLLGKNGLISALELKVQGEKIEDVRIELENLLGSDYNIKTKFELNEIIYQTNRSEKIVTFFILTFILVIASFNVISSLTMILLEKEKDIRTMRFIGMDLKKLRSVFVTEGMIINIIGVGIGMLSGLLLCLLQIYFGLVRLEGGIVEFYPVKLMAVDLVVILITALTIGYFAAFFPARILIRGNIYDNTSSTA